MTIEQVCRDYLTKLKRPPEKIDAILARVKSILPGKGNREVTEEEAEALRTTLDFIYELPPALALSLSQQAIKKHEQKN